jgi:ABC-2 type transport system permease protein
MGASWTMALWEIKRMLKNKAYLLSILLTPVIMLLFIGIPQLLVQLEAGKVFSLHVVDGIGVFEALSREIALEKVEIHRIQGEPAELQKAFRDRQSSGFLVLNAEALATGQVTLYTGGEGFPDLSDLSEALAAALQKHLMLELGLSPEAVERAAAGFSVQTVSLLYAGDSWQRFTPVVFAGLMIFAVFISGMATMQSAMAEKKDRIVEVLLSTTTAAQLMQGKIIGYFGLGLLQVAAWVFFAALSVNFIFKIPVHRYLWTPQLPVMLFFALGGYLLYSALLAGMGATIDDLHAAGNFQGIIFLLPVMPLVLAAPVIQNPNGPVAMVGSYFPSTTAGVMLLRLALSRSLTFSGILGPALILGLSAWLVMRLAGRIFKMGLLMYGKNATPREIWRGLRHSRD